MTKRILLTGGAGFIGHHIIDLFMKNTDWEIVTLDRLDYSGNLNRLNDVISKYPKTEQKRVKIVWHDLKAEIKDLNANFIGKIDTILHLAASSHVDRSISNPLEFLMDNTLGTVNLLEYARRLDGLDRLIYFSTDEIFGAAPPGVLYKEYDRYNSTNPYSASKAAAEEFCVAYENSYKLPIFVTHCHDQNTNCWSEKGIVNIDKLCVGDRVWTLKNNKEMSLEPILEIVNSPYEGEMINFNTGKHSLSVTPNHRMLTKFRGEKDWTIKTAYEMSLSNERQYIPLTGEWNIDDNDNVVDLSTYINFDKLHFNANVPNKTVQKEDFMKFVGWYVTEGFCRKKRRSGPSICQKKNNLQEIYDVMNIFGINISTQISQSGTTIFTINSNDVGKFCSDAFGASSEDKKLPNWIKNSSKKNLSLLFDTMMKGDGTIHKSYRRFYTTSYRLAQDFAEISIKLGFSCGIQKRETWNPKKTKKSLSYYVSLRKAVGGVEPHQITKTQYKGNIWCVRTSSGNFFVERNGHIMCSGNTMNVFGERQHPEKFIPMCIRKIRDNEKIFIHSNPNRTQAGSRFYISAKDVAESMQFLLTLDSSKFKIIKEHMDFLDVRCPKFNIVGKEEIDNLSMVNILADAQRKDPIYEMVDFHTSRPGHDLRYSLDGSFMRKLGWEPKISLEQRLHEVSHWSLANKEWIELSE